jgi:hypothetical protein
MSGKGQSQKPVLAGVGYLDFTTNETNVPHTYFAGTRNLPVSWIMEPVITMIKATPGSGGKGK